MAQLNIRIDDRTRDELDALAQARGLNTSDLLRDLVSRALGRDEGRPADSTTPRSLSAFQRRQLALQHEILSLINTGPEWETEYHTQMIEILNTGLTSEYYKTFQMIEPELTDRESALTRDILDMFDFTERSIELLAEAELASLGNPDVLRFRGFDFNNRQEGRLATYARFLINDDKWPRLADRFDDAHERGNSHMPTLATYQRMLTVFKPFREKIINSYGGPNSYNLSLEQLREIHNAWAYPKN